MFSKVSNIQEAGKSHSTLFFQAKLTVNTPGDAHEREADAVADQVMRMREGDAPIVQRMPVTPVSSLQRTCAACEHEKEKEKEGVQRKETSGGDASGKAAPSVVSDVLSSGSGQPMESGTRQFMESRFGQDFSQVRIHTDHQAARSARSIQAQAYTSGTDIVFDEGRYQPNTASGNHLLAHELTHVGQQGGVRRKMVQRRLGDGHDLSSPRFAGDTVLESCFDKKRTISIGSSGTYVSKIQQALVDAGFPLPNFGVDGNFGNETKSALINFQTSKRLRSIDGILGPETMGSLDAHFSGPVPAPPTPAPPSVCTITSRTLAAAPNGSPSTRTNIGVNEQVELRSSVPVTWTATRGTFSVNTGTTTTWTAPDTAGNDTITGTPNSGVACTKVLSVIAPSNRAMTVTSNRAYTAGLAGSGFVANVVIQPTSVSFSRVEVREESVAAAATGYYDTVLHWKGIIHPQTTNWLPLDANNSGIIDTVGTNPPGSATPFSAGTFNWPIPQSYRPAGSGAGHNFSTGTHQQTMQNNTGNETTSKEGATNSRTP